jgi:hypothetical protein
MSADFWVAFGLLAFTVCFVVVLFTPEKRK